MLLLPSSTFPIAVVTLGDILLVILLGVVVVLLLALAKDLKAMFSDQ